MNPLDNSVPPKFFADVMVGRLARWLRILGYDTLYARDIDDAQLLRIAEHEGRIVLTRDTGILKRKTGAEVVFLESEKPKLQLRQLREHANVRKREQYLFTRCSWCNSTLQTISRGDVSERVPPYVFGTETVFLHCSYCDKIYWRGTHKDRFLEQLFSDHVDSQEQQG
jgi:uncharacterized protein with PIN domain